MGPGDEGGDRCCRLPADTRDLSRRESQGEADFCLGQQVSLAMHPEVRMQWSTGITNSQEVGVGTPWPETLAPGLNLPGSRGNVSFFLPEHVAQSGCHLRPPGRLSLECFSRCLGSPGHNHSLGFQDVYSFPSLGNISPPPPRTERHLPSLLRIPLEFTFYLQNVASSFKKGSHEKPQNKQTKNHCGQPVASSNLPGNSSSPRSFFSLGTITSEDWNRHFRR